MGALTKKKPRCRGRRRYFSTSQKFLGANAGGAGIVVRYFAVLFVHFFLLLAGLTGFLFRLLLLLLSGLLLAAALLLLLVTLIRHSVYSLLESLSKTLKARCRFGVNICERQLVHRPVGSRSK